MASAPVDTDGSVERGHKLTVMSSDARAMTPSEAAIAYPELRSTLKHVDAMQQWLRDYTARTPSQAGENSGLLNSVFSPLALVVGQMLGWPELLTHLPDSSAKRQLNDPPRTAADAAKQQQRAAELLADGRLEQAAPLLFGVAIYQLWVVGAEHPDTLRAVHAVIENCYIRNEVPCAKLIEWLLPHAAAQWGLDSPDTRLLVRHGARHLEDSKELRGNGKLLQIMQDIVQRLPGGLGWGTATVTPLSDPETFNRYAFLTGRAVEAMKQGELALSKDMLQRCVAYFGAFGPHWLASPRKLTAQQLLALCAAAGKPRRGRAAVRRVQAHGAARAGQGASGHVSEHLASCRVFAGHGPHGAGDEPLQQSATSAKGGRVPPAKCKARVYRKAGLLQAARDLLHSVFGTAVKALHPRKDTVTQILHLYWAILHDDLGDRRGAAALRKRAAKLGCDISLLQ